jgi:uncharacterized protein (DUF58 family)
MELIPILATIILVATISTFFLAIGAYALYKIRERRGEQVEIQAPSTVQAEVLTPEVIYEQSQTKEAARAPAAPTFEPSRVPSYRPSAEPIFVRTARQQPTTQPAQAKYTPAPQQFVPQRQEQPRQVQAGPPQSATSEQKFMKYTAEGYVPAKEGAKSGGGLKWR